MPALEIRGAAVAPLDEPLALNARGAGPDAGDLVWRARLLDDEGRVWRAVAGRAEALAAAWTPAKATTGAVAALGSLRPVRIDVRVEAPDGRTAARTIERRIVADGVRVRRWRAPVAGTLCRPPAGDGAEAPVATVVLDASEGDDALAVAAIAGPLLAGRGVVALTVARQARAAADPLAAAADALAAVPGTGEPVVLTPPVPPNLPLRDGDAAAHAAAWDALLERLGARPR